MIKAYVTDIASHMGMNLSKVSLTGGLAVACSDYLLEIVSKGHMVRTLIHQSEIDSLQNCSPSGFLELRIKAALERLMMLQEP